MTDNLPSVEFIDIDPEVQKAAQAAMDRGGPLRVPKGGENDFGITAKETVDKKTQEVYYRWVEGAVVEHTWKEPGKNGLLAAVVQLKIRTGYPNQGRIVFARHMLNYPLLMGQPVDLADDKKKGHEFMNNASINALTTLFKATGFPQEKGIKGSVLSMMFPSKDQPGAKAPIVGKSLMVNLTDVPNKGEKATTERKTGVETYLPETE